MLNLGEAETGGQMNIFKIRRKLLLILFAAVVVSAKAQLPVSPAHILKVNHFFDERVQGDSLKCSIERIRPTLDFALRFRAGFLVHCPLAEFDHKETIVAIYARVTPEAKTPVLLGEGYRLPTITPAMLSRLGHRRLNNTFFNMSGGFTVGEGAYLVEVLALDDRNRMCRKQWRIKAARDGRQRPAPLLIEPDTVRPLLEIPGEVGPPERGKGLRLTILLDAAPINPRQARLRAWDRAFLLSSLWTLLRQTPSTSVRLVAFNLDQQSEIFRQDRFDRAALTRLGMDLQSLELETVSVKVLQRSESEFLANLVNQEIGTDEPSDAVVILGPATRFTRKTRPEMLKKASDGGPRFFNFEYYPWHGAEFPDAVEYLTHALHGTTYKIHSPGELGQAIQKMLAELKQD
jgi:hypothetical protein